MSKWVNGHMSRDVCPYNVKFASALPDESPLRGACEALAGEDARTLAREALAMTPAAFGAALRGSPM